jgi:hypothetical protein
MKPACSRRSTFRCATIGLLLSLLGLSGVVQAQTIKFCVYDPLGAQGDFFATAKDYKIEARKWGVDIELKPYSDETVSVEDFKAGQCDLINMLGLRTRLGFNQFTGTIDSPGSVENYAEMRDVLNLMASPKLEKLMVNGQYEVAGILPVGAGYIFVHDRKLNTLAKAAGKKVGVMDWDKTQAMLVQQVGAQPIASDLTNYGGRFNNGQVDVIIAPIILYKPFELSKGVGSTGGIIRRAVIQLSLQLVARRDRFPPEFGRQSRAYVANQVDRAFGIIRNLENQVDQRQWMYVTTAERDDFYKVMREARVHLAKDGFYDKRMLSILKRVRCKSNPEDAECTLTEE